MDLFTCTISRNLIKNNLSPSLPRIRPAVSPKKVEDRIIFAKSHVDWSKEKWHNILWTDETKIHLFRSDSSRTYVRRTPYQEYNPLFTIKTIKHGEGNTI